MIIIVFHAVDWVFITGIRWNVAGGCVFIRFGVIHLVLFQPKCVFSLLFLKYYDNHVKITYLFGIAMFSLRLRHLTRSTKSHLRSSGSFDGLEKKIPNYIMT